MDLSIKRFLKFFNRMADEPPDAASNPASYKRSFDRFPLEFEVIASVVDGGMHPDSERGELHDVSGGGAMFISRFPERYHPGQLLRLDIFLAGTADVRACIKTEASVVRMHPIEAKGSEKEAIRTGIAVKFHKPFEFERIDKSFFR